MVIGSKFRLFCRKPNGVRICYRLYLGVMFQYITFVFRTVIEHQFAFVETKVDFQLAFLDTSSQFYFSICFPRYLKKELFDFGD